MTFVLSAGKLLLRAGQLARSLACCCSTNSGPTGACCTNGVCTTTTKSDCAGIWQGPNTLCSGGSCLGQCCVPEGTCGTVKYYNCRTGYFSSTCTAAGGRVGACTQAKVHPATGIDICADGGPSQVTVTMTGAVPSETHWQPVADMCNSSYVLDMPCSGIFAGTVNTVAVTPPGGGPGTWFAYYSVQFWSPSLTFLNGSILVDFRVGRLLSDPAPSGVARSSFSHGKDLPQDYLQCDFDGSGSRKRIFDCTNYALAAGGSAGSWELGRAVVLDNATVSLS